VDLICAGLPCQPYSVAGRQLGDDDERALWPEFIRVVGEVEPALVFLENVPPFIRYFRPVGCELQRMGYRVEEPLFVTAAECGAAHKRERVFILAQPTQRRRRELREPPRGNGLTGGGIQNLGNSSQYGSPASTEQRTCQGVAGNRTAKPQ
jgi:DNA (cytosine-5)-methyltransferase 1